MVVTAEAASTRIGMKTNLISCPRNEELVEICIDRGEDHKCCGLVSPELIAPAAGRESINNENYYIYSNPDSDVEFYIKETVNE
jgi:hypothetical protein